MSHVVIIIQQNILPPPEAQLASSEGPAMTARIEYTPSHTMTDRQIGDQVERIVKRLSKLADD